MNGTTTVSGARGAPTVTIVTPSYNQGHFIRATIESVLSQDYPDLEYVVMDGGSTDQTAAIVEEYGSRLKWISERDRGQSHAINKGFAMAHGEIVAWLNSDDILLPGAVSGAVKAFDEASSGVGAIYGEGYLMDRNGRVTGRFPATEPFNLWRLVYLSDYILQQSTFFRRDAVAEVGWLDENLNYAMDWDLLIRLGKRFGLHYVPEYFGVLREYQEAKTSAGGGARIEEIRRVLERHTGLSRAPGYWMYALEMLRSRYKNRLQNGSPARLYTTRALVDFFFYHATAIPLMLINRSQGLHSDSWVSDRLQWMLPEAAREVIVRGHLPVDSKLVGQKLSVRSAGRELGAWKVAPGDFALRFGVPRDCHCAFHFEIQASRYKLPSLRTERSFRGMAWILDAIEWSKKADAESHDTMPGSLPL